MRKTLLTAVALSAMASTAMAADLPRRAPAPAPAPMYVAPIFTWTGFYVGGQLGGAWSANNTNGFIGGGHVGYNYQMNNSFVVGLEGDFEGTSLKGSRAFFPGVLVKNRINWQASIRARAGVAFDRALIYATGGVAFAGLRNELIAPPFSVSASNTRTGWTIGAGVEYALTNNWSARVEYRYADFGRRNDGFGFLFANNNNRVQEHAVRVGVSYRFGGPAGPVVASY
ncbi:MAG: hypothetical protein BGP04_11360 [Rhizobiales bacterium 62-17]|nr:porin family protein [Hyphomicrobiales bacterium]OJY05916.1 MAG: hypothetical protein BGP04_11360 [Rhizobiales bacterium 62-17]